MNTVKEEIRGNCSSNKKDEESKRLESFAAINSPFLWWILKKSIFFSGFKDPYRNETRKLESIHKQHFVERKNEGRKPDKNWSLTSFEFMPRNIY